MGFPHASNPLINTIILGAIDASLAIGEVFQGFFTNQTGGAEANNTHRFRMDVRLIQVRCFVNTNAGGAESFCEARNSAATIDSVTIGIGLTGWFIGNVVDILVLAETDINFRLDNNSAGIQIYKYEGMEFVTL